MVMEKDGLSEKDAVAFIEKTDRKRADYYNFFTGRHWGDSSGYDICLNTSKFGIEGTIKIICESIGYCKRL